MKCDLCDNPATVHTCDIRKGIPVNKHLCQSCADDTPQNYLLDAGVPPRIADKCDYCGQPSTVHLTKSDAGQSLQIHLCDACAAQHDGMIHGDDAGLSLPIIPDAKVYVPEEQLPAEDPAYQALIARANRNRANWKPPKATRPYLLLAVVGVPLLGFGLLCFLTGQSMSWGMIVFTIMGAVMTFAAFSKY